ncbi:MAG: tRNA (N(6)-L-threonylcarbamoyladenosine(37)-C(2))-methylthiotransferase MtaB [Gammaproteobacteria bacterium]|nr:tRNA (N(6)-L-threonylcarbamoyladenosine(37)-C(2))-methylthiotransferase MtaB [Gammaproteobacteria bacterium]
MNINFRALGCRLNEAELESWASQFMKLGHQVSIDSADADIVVFNSCAVTSEADRKSRQQINKLRRENPDAKLVVTGCHASLNIEAVKDYLGVDMVVGNADKEILVDRILEGFNIDVIANTEPVDNTLFLRGRHRAFIKVQDGCRYRCSYCIVTIARGAERSRGIDDIVAEINYYHQIGVQEITLTGAHVGGYGSDNGSCLYTLLCAILMRTEVPRVRLASVEPWDLADNFFGLFQDQRLMPHMHLPIQSGCDNVLRRMSRRCKTAEFSCLVEKAREAIPLFNITTDVIVGFPGETDREWQQTMRYIESVGFGHIHVFPFSPRNGTRAASFPDQVASSTKKFRVKEMQELAVALKRKALEQHLGTGAMVLWEQKTGAGQWLGYTPHYHRVMSYNNAVRESEISQVRLDQIGDSGSVLLNLEANTSIPVELN